MIGKTSFGKFVSHAHIIALLVLLLAAPAGASKTPITMWFSSQPQSVFNWVPQFVEEFNAQNPDIELKVETFQWVSQQRDKLIVASTAGSGPDIFYDSSNVMSMWVQNGLALPLDNYVASWSDLSDFIPDVVNDLRYDGRLYGMPISVNPFWDMYNLDLFQAAGMGLPGTWDEMVKVATKMTRVDDGDNIEVNGYALTSLKGLYTYIDFERALEQLGTRSVEATGSTATINTSAGNRALRYLRDVAQAGMPGMKSAGFASNKVAIQHWASSRDLEKAIDLAGGADNLNVSLRRYVGPEPGSDVTHYLAGTFFILKTSNYPDAAWRVLQAWVQAKNLDSYLKAYGTNLPVRKSMLGNQELFTRPFAQEMVGLLSGRIIPYGSRHALYTTFRAPVGEFLSQALLGKIAVGNALEQAEVTMNQIVAEGLPK